MAELLSRLVGLLMLREGPQDLPPGSGPLILAIAMYAGVNALAMQIAGTPDSPYAMLALAIVLPLVLVRIVLTLKGHAARWAQTLTALFGAGALLSALTLPLGVFAGESPSAPLAVVSLVLFIWSFAVDAHIWRHALDSSFAVGLAVAVVLFAISISLINWLAGPI
jgi:hypothetical protein